MNSNIDRKYMIRGVITVARTIMIAGTHSGVGKTTLSLGIMRAIRDRGYSVAPYKVGPDYIDPMFHKIAASNTSINLDAVLFGPWCKDLYKNHLKEEDIGIIEGVMGLYDGLDFTLDNGSSAHLSRLLDVPVILIINAKGMAASVIAHIKGYMDYDTNVNIAGIILNQVNSEMLYQYLKKPIEEHFKVPCLGYLPYTEEISLSSRHLGLIPAEEVKLLEKQLNTVATLIEKYIDIDKIIEIAKEEPIGIKKQIDEKQLYKTIRIGIAKDKAFSFYYEDNLDYLESLGMTLVPFSPLYDETLPKDLDALYIGGGFPEVFAKELENNTRFRADIKQQLEDGLPAYAECGGLIYLCNSYTDIEGNETDMVGYFNQRVIMTNKLQRFGYVEMETESGIIIRGHEFHHTKLEEDKESTYYNITKLSNRNRTWQDGLRKNNVLATYPHIHFYSNLEWVKQLLSKHLSDWNNSQ